jgi:ATP-dependent protease ClpP protease subunit
MKIGAQKYANKDTDYIQYIHQHGLDIKAREIWITPTDEIAHGIGEPIYGDPGVEYTMTTRFLKNLHILMNISSDPILIHLKTMGGDWSEGMAIYDTIKTSPCHITALNYTHARSMSSLIFSACDKRVMMPHSVFMFHDGSMGYEGTAKQFLTEAEQLKISSRQMLSVYSEVMMANSPLWNGKGKKACEKWLRDAMDKKEEVYLNPIDAISHGFADSVFDGDWDSLSVPKGE